MLYKFNKMICQKVNEILFFCFLISMISCHVQKASINSGVIYLNTKSYNPNVQEYNKEPIFPDLKIWYKDSLVIEQIKLVNINTDTTQLTTITHPIDGYVFIDLKSKSFYHYKTFSDTALIINKYTQPDSLPIQGNGGWNFYNSRDLKLIGNPETLSDTVINNLTYKRVKLFTKIEEDIVIQIGYLECDRKNSFFQLYTNLGKKLGCPIVRLDDLPSIQNPKAVSVQIDFVSDKLTSNEMKVFNAWEKNARKNPVNK